MSSVWKTTINEGRPWIERNLGWKKILDGNQIDVDENIGWKKTLKATQIWVQINFNGRQPLIDEKGETQTTFDKMRTFNERKHSRWHLMKDPLWQKMTSDQRLSLVEDNLQLKTVFNWRQLLMVDDL